MYYFIHWNRLLPWRNCLLWSVVFCIMTIGYNSMLWTGALSTSVNHFEYSCRSGTSRLIWNLTTLTFKRIDSNISGEPPARTAEEMPRYMPAAFAEESMRWNSDFLGFDLCGGAWADFKANEWQNQHSLLKVKLLCVGKSNYDVTWSQIY